MIGNRGIADFLLLLFVASPVVALIYMFWQGWKQALEPERGAVSVQYEPPESLSPAECGALLSNSVALSSITATITDLSVKGYLAIEQTDESKSPGGHRDYLFHLIKPASDWENLKPHEQAVLKSIFFPTNPMLLLSEALSQLQAHSQNAALSSTLSHVRAKADDVYQQFLAIGGVADSLRTSVAFSELQNQFALHLTAIRDAIFDKLVALGYYEHRPDRVRQVYAVKGIFFGFVLAVVGAFLAAVTRTAPLLLILTGLLTGAIILGFGWFLPVRTPTGAQTLVKVQGFQEFLGRVEKDHIERLEKTPDLFEKYLPYAMALSVDKKWTQTFAAITLPPPHWYRAGPGGGFMPMDFVSDFHEVSRQTGSGLTSSPSASSAVANSPDADSNKPN
ncbi:MAG: DUF2207 domain-containing protein [Candidatus Acidiferrales bacterium]